MRQNSQTFNVFNQSSSKDLRLVIAIEFTTPVYFSSHSDIPNLPAGTITDTVQKTSSISQSIKPDVGRAEIGSLSFSLLDVGGLVTQAFRNSNNINEGMKDVKVRLYRGGLGMDFADFRVEQTQRIDKEVSFKDGLYNIVCADIQRVLRKDIFDLSITQLSTDFSAGDSVVNVTTTNGFEACSHVSSFNDKPTGQYYYLKIFKGDYFEIVRATGKTATSFTGITRGLFGTENIDHVIPDSSDKDNGIKVQEYVYLELPTSAMVYALLTGNIIGGGTIPSTWNLGIPSIDIDIDSYINIGTDLFDQTDFSKGFIIRFENLSKTDGKAFIEKQICLLMGAFMPVLADGRLSLKRMTGVLSTADAIAELNVDNIASHSKIKFDNSKIYNQLEISWAFMQFTGQDAQFYRKHTLLDANSINKHGKGSTYKQSFKGLHSSRHTVTTINNRFDALRDRYAGPPLFLTVTLLPSLNDLEVGDIVRVNLPEQRDFMSFDRLDRSFEIQRVLVDQISGKVTVSLFGSSEQAGEIIASDASVSAELPNAWYNGEGSDIAPSLTLVNGILQADASIVGGSTLRTIFYYLGDLTIPNGKILTLVDNAELRVMGHLQVDGEIRCSGTKTNVSTKGFLGNTKSGGGWYYNGYLSGLEIYGNVASGYHSSLPSLEINNDAGVISGIPSDMRGTTGQFGAGNKIYDVESKTYLTNTLGGAGGAGGGSAVIVARGVGFGVVGVINTSGNDGDVGSQVLSPDFYSGSGAGGAPGCCVILIDGIDANFPIMSGSIKAEFGLSPVLGSEPKVGTAPWHSSSYFRGKSIDTLDLKNSVARAYYVPKSRIPYPTTEEIIINLPDTSGVIYSPLSANINNGVLSWDKVSDSFNASYKVNIYDNNGDHVWVKYADDVSGTNLTDSAAGKSYIGFALSKSTSVKSIVPTDYQWFVIDHSSGYEITGLQGEPRFIWVKYSTNLQGINPVDTHAGNNYIGLAINERSSTKSNNSSDYEWFSAFGTTSLDFSSFISLISSYIVTTNEFYITGLAIGKYIVEVNAFTASNKSISSSVQIQVTENIISLSQAKADAAEISAKAYADGIVTAEEQRAINDAQAKADLAETQSKAYADGIVTAEEQRAIADAQAKANLAEVTAKAYADGIVTAEEARAIADAQAKADLAEQNAKNHTDSQLTNYVTDSLYASEKAVLQSQIDKAITTWFYDGTPTLANEPALNWSTIDDKNTHLGDLYYDNLTGYAYRFMINLAVYSWNKVSDSDVTKALADAAKAQDTADSKRRVFVSTPVVPYDIGDLWDTGTGIKRATIAKADVAAYSSSDWVLVSDTTDYSDSRVSNTVAATAAQTKADLAETQSKAYADGIVTAEEQRAINDAQVKADSAQAAAIADIIKRTQFINNMLDVSSWVIGSTGSQGSFSLNGTVSENKIILSDSPSGTQEPIWECVSDGSNSASGGWINNIGVNDGFDHTKSYRVIAWAKQQSTTGTTYLGCLGSKTYNLNDTVNTNPYFFSSDLPQNNKWYLLVGVIHGSGYSGGSVGIAGVYDPETGQKVVSATEFKNAVGATSQTHRVYSYYDTTIGDTKWFARPRFEEINGNEPALITLMSTNALLNSVAIAAADTAAQAKANLAQTTAQAYADGIVTAEEQRAINDAQAKADAAQAAAISAAALTAQAKADTAQANAISTAATAAQTKADLAQTTAQAYADGIVTAEEQRAINDAQAKADAAEALAKAYADLNVSNQTLYTTDALVTDLMPTGSPLAKGFIRSVSSSHYSSSTDLIPVRRGETLFLEMWAKRNGTTAKAYMGIERYDRNKKAIDVNSGTSYTGLVNTSLTTSWVKYVGSTTLPVTHTPYNGSDGLEVCYVRVRLLFNRVSDDTSYYSGFRLYRKVAWGDNLDSVPTQQFMPNLVSAGAGTALSANPLSAADVGSTTTITIAAHTRQYGFGLLSINAGSVAGLSFSTKYYVYYDDPSYLGGAVTYFATTNLQTVAAGNNRIYISSITTPADGGGTTEPPILDCVCLDMFLLENLQAKNVTDENSIDLWWHGDTYSPGKVLQSKPIEAPQVCVEIETTSGAKVQVSANTPVELKNHIIIKAIDCLGEKLAVIIDDLLIWEKVIACKIVGEKQVMRISVGNGSFAAGVNANKRIVTHNAQVKP